MATVATLAFGAGVLGFLLSVVATLLHTAEEVFGEGGPFWDYAAELIGLRLSWFAGAGLFASLAAILVALAAGGYLLSSTWCLSVLLGARLGDALASHVGLAWLYRRPNPGAATAPLYLIEVGLALLWIAANRQGERLSIVWLAGGAAAFVVPSSVLLLRKMLR